MNLAWLHNSWIGHIHLKPFRQLRLHDSKVIQFSDQPLFSWIHLLAISSSEDWHLHMRLSVWMRLKLFFTVKFVHLKYTSKVQLQQAFQSNWRFKYIHFFITAYDSSRLVYCPASKAKSHGNDNECSTINYRSCYTRGMWSLYCVGTVLGHAPQIYFTLPESLSLMTQVGQGHTKISSKHIRFFWRWTFSSCFSASAVLTANRVMHFNIGVLKCVI